MKQIPMNAILAGQAVLAKVIVDGRARSEQP
jgi:hypothetical protein